MPLCVLGVEIVSPLTLPFQETSVSTSNSGNEVGVLLPSHSVTHSKLVHDWNISCLSSS